MAKNDFKAFAIGENANTLSQEEYESSDFIGEGFKSGIARSERLNKVWRQSSIIAAVIGKYIAEKTGEDVMDDGDLEKLTRQLDQALKQKITTEIPDASLTQKGISQLNSATNSDREDQAATPKAVHDIRKIAESKLSGVSDASLTQKGIVQLSSATNSTNETLAATPKAIKEAYDFANTANVAAKNAHDEANRATDNANSRLAKNQNGADIPDKSEFIKNLGLVETVKLAQSAVPGSRKINGKALTGDVSLNAGDVGSYAKSESDSKYQPRGNYQPAGNYAVKGESYTKEESDGRYDKKQKTFRRIDKINGYIETGSVIDLDEDIRGKYLYVKWENTSDFVMGIIPTDNIFVNFSDRSTVYGVLYTTNGGKKLHVERNSNDRITQIHIFE
ncbi:tail fiber protein [Photorhabdus sp. CRCIA-P01]|uniref:tail fiber protein n=1 Tax=Photorhabdus sp. CRCIA-P01 TaxID=2019570 RepID=UPI001E2C86E7|nr:tail fiber protein [Photorhabdus sp. CRCIA-P01]